jgi:hypothetical protein
MPLAAVCRLQDLLAAEMPARDITVDNVHWTKFVTVLKEGIAYDAEKENVGVKLNNNVVTVRNDSTFRAALQAMYNNNLRGSYIFYVMPKKADKGMESGIKHLGPGPTTTVADPGNPKPTHHGTVQEEEAITTGTNLAATTDLSDVPSMNQCAPVEQAESSKKRASSPDQAELESSAKMQRAADAALPSGTSDYRGYKHATTLRP